MTDKKDKGMVDVGLKETTERRARAEAVVCLSSEAFQALISNACPKGDVLASAKIAGIMAVKKTPDVIPLCHPLEISKANVRFDCRKEEHKVYITSEVAYSGKTGVEMEALTAVSIAALTIYDMMKYADKGMRIEHIQLISKSGGQSGDYQR